MILPNLTMLETSLANLAPQNIFQNAYRVPHLTTKQTTKFIDFLIFKISIKYLSIYFLKYHP